MAKKRVVVIGASGYVAGQMLPTLREKYETVLLDASPTTSPGRHVASTGTIPLPKEGEGSNLSPPFVKGG